MRNIKLLIEYDGTRYYGWQKQKDRETIQEEIEKAIEIITKEKVDLIGCSRTDAGVHAKGFIANFKTNSRVPGNKFREALNTKLPNDIVIIESMEVKEDFHSRYDAIGKTYVYSIYNNRVPTALHDRFTYHVKDELNIEKMNEACKFFIGRHDFSAFKSSGSSVKTSVRTIKDLKIEKYDKILKISVTGDGFLYNMVRIIVGTLIMVGREKIDPEYISYIINSLDRTLAGECVPAKGLILEEVYY